MCGKSIQGTQNRSYKYVLLHSELIALIWFATLIDCMLSALLGQPAILHHRPTLHQSLHTRPLRAGVSSTMVPQDDTIRHRLHFIARHRLSILYYFPVYAHRGHVGYPTARNVSRPQCHRDIRRYPRHHRALHHPAAPPARAVEA